MAFEIILAPAAAPHCARVRESHYETCDDTRSNTRHTRRRSRRSRAARAGEREALARIGTDRLTFGGVFEAQEGVASLVGLGTGVEPTPVERMMDRGLTEVELRRMLEHARDYRENIVEDRWIIEVSRGRVAWEVHRRTRTNDSVAGCRDGVPVTAWRYAE